MGTPEPATVFEVVGGQPFFDALAARFYAGVAQDEVLRPLYPEDLAAPARHMAGFLAQYWGGPTTYSDARGHPRLRLRHLPFHIGREERDRWLEHMSAAIETATAELPDPAVAEAEAAALGASFHPAAEQLRNDTGLPISSPRSGPP